MPLDIRDLNHCSCRIDGKGYCVMHGVGPAEDHPSYAGAPRRAPGDHIGVPRVRLGKRKGIDDVE